MENELKIKVEPDNEITLEHFKHGDWDFYWHTEKMMPSKDLDQLGPFMKVKNIPDMTFGYNRLLMINQKNNFIYEINPLHMLDLSSYEERNKAINNGSIYYIPRDLKVKYYDKWKDIKVDREDVQKLDATMDWTYCSPYMGTLQQLNKHKLYESDIFKAESHNYRIEKTDESIPINRLGKENQIIKYTEINLFEDELCDNGLTHGYLRYRIMNDCFFGLLRSYLRIDHVQVRIMDTRIFHSFGDNYILREFTVKENTYDELINKGFRFTSEWSLSPSQSDVISQYVDIEFTQKDKIIFE